MKPIFKNNNFHCLFWSLFFSQFGSFLFYISFLWQVQVKTGSANAVGIIGASATIPALFSVFFGVLADRSDKKRLLLYSDAVRAIILVVLFALTSIHEPSLLFYVIIVFLISSFQALFNTTLESTIPLLFERETFVQVNSLLSTAIQVAAVLGGVAAGFITAHSIVLVINIFTYIISFLFLLFLKRKDVPLHEKGADHEEPKQNLMKEMTEGIKFLLK